MEPIVKKFSEALGKRAGNHQVVPFAKEALDAGHITQDEYQLVLDAEEARLEIINVDDFSPEEMKHHLSEN